MKAQVWTVPNGLSTLRLVLVPTAAMVLLTQSNDGLAIGLLAIAGATDWLDGYLARKLNQVSELGTLLDPLADRLAILCFVAALSWRGAFSPWLLAVVAARDLGLASTIPKLRKHGRWALPVTRTGKVATALLFAGLPLSMIGVVAEGSGVLLSIAQGILWLGAAVYWVAGIGYLRAVMRLPMQSDSETDHGR
jgi:cardiolipin synthase